MSFLDRLEKLQYESPNKKLFTLDFEEVTRSGGKKVSVNEFPYKDITNEQELGNIANRFPITCYIIGDNYDREADRFWKALEENGVGILDHPRWGSYDVIPISYSQSENFINGMGYATFTIEFIRYYPEAEAFFAFLNAPFEFAQGIFDAVDRVLSVENSIRRGANTIQRNVGTTEAEFRRIKGRTQSVLNQFKKQSKSIIQRSQELRNRINEQTKKIERGIDQLVREPVSLVTELNTLFSIPSKATASISQKLDTYKSMLDFTFLQLNEPTALFSNFELTLQGCIATSATTYLAEASLEGESKTRTDSISTANSLYNSKLQLKNIFDDIESKGGVVSYDVYNRVSRLIAVCQKLVLNRSLRLPTDRVVILESEMTPLNFCFKYLNDINRLDEMIDYNNLRGNELIVIPKGREMRYVSLEALR